MNSQKNSCAILYSGGTDSSCVVSLAAKNYTEIHLITFRESSTAKSSLPVNNVEKFKSMFPNVNFVCSEIEITPIIKILSYKSYLKSLLRFHLLNLSTPGFSSLSWHLTTLAYCKKKSICTVFDGLTCEHLQFPGHMQAFIKMLKLLYSDYSISYSNPVRSWKTPPDRSLLDRLVVDQHGYLYPQEELDQMDQDKTTGQHLKQIGFFEQTNIKGSRKDQSMQADCYPFVLYNILFFWVLSSFWSYDKAESKIVELFHFKLNLIDEDLKNYFNFDKKNALGIQLEKCLTHAKAY